MPAAVRGARRADAKPRANVAAAPARGRASTARPSGKAAPARGGISPKLTLAIAGVVLIGGVAIALATGHRGERLVNGVEQGVFNQFAAAGFKLEKVHVQGASTMAQADVLKAAGLYKDQPLIGMDLAAVKANVEKVGWVKEARIIRLLPNTLVIAVTERDAQAVWQHAGHTYVIDHKGAIIPEADPMKFPDLPLVVGAGANAEAAAIMPEIQQRPRLRDRIEALVRVDARRWDLRLKDGSIIQLPAINEGQALMQLDQLDAREHLLDLGFERVDLRDPEMIAVRPRSAVAAAPKQPVADGV